MRFDDRIGTGDHQALVKGHHGLPWWGTALAFVVFTSIATGGLMTVIRWNGG